MGVTFVILQCQGLIYQDGCAGGCCRIYTARKVAFTKRLNKCPECGSSKAKWEGPTRTRPRKKPRDPEEG